MIYFRLRAAVSKVCLTMMLLFLTMLCYQYIIMALWNGSEVQTAAQHPEVSDGEDGIKPERQLPNGVTLNTPPSHGIQDLRKNLDGIGHKIESSSASGNIKSPSNGVEMKPADASSMGRRDGLVEIGPKSEEEKVSKSEANMAGNLKDGFDLDDENKKSDYKKLEADFDSKSTVSATSAIHKPQPMTSNSVNLEGSIHSHAERNQVLKLHHPAKAVGDAASSAQGTEPETNLDRTLAEVIQPPKLTPNQWTKNSEPETNDSAEHESSDRSRPSNFEQNKSIIENNPERNRIEIKYSNISWQTTSDKYNSSSGNQPETNASRDEFSDRPRAIILWSYWRSGSTFLADLLVNTSPNVTFYSFEPLFRYGKRVLTKGHESETQEAVSFLKDLLKCDLRAHKDYVTDNSKLSFMLHANTYLSGRCAEVDKCGDVETFSKTCLSASLHIAKITRLSAQYAKAFLEDPQFKDLQIVYLLRDPRAIMWSRLRSGKRGHSWCGDPTSSSCSVPKTVCGLMEADIKMSQAVWASYKERFFALRYEDLTFRPQATVDSLWKPLRLPVTDTFRRYLDQATTGHKPANQRTDSTRHSHNHTFRWRTEAPWGLIQRVQQECSGVIQQFGFTMFESEEELRNMTIPVAVGSGW